MSRAKAKPKAPPTNYIRWMIRRDMAEVLEIESLCFASPWCEDEFVEFLRVSNCIGKIVERDDHVIGYVLYELQKTRLDIFNFAVRPRHHREGIGSQMIADLKGKLSTQRRTSIIVSVREANLDAQLFFREMGFRHAQTLRSFYDDTDTDEDTYLLKYRYQPAELVT